MQSIFDSSDHWIAHVSGRCLPVLLNGHRVDCGNRLPMPRFLLDFCHREFETKSFQMSAHLLAICSFAFFVSTLPSSSCTKVQQNRALCAARRERLYSLSYPRSHQRCRRDDRVSPCECQTPPSALMDGIRHTFARASHSPSLRHHNNSN